MNNNEINNKNNNYSIIDYIIEESSLKIYKDIATLTKNKSNNNLIILKCFHNFSNLIKNINFEDENIIKIKKSFWLNFLDLTNINLNSNYIQKFSKNFFDLKNLKKLEINNNNLTYIPKDFSKLKNLKYLSLKLNKIENIPNSIFKLDLNYFDISFNLLTNIPIEIGYMKNLENFNILGNKLNEIPTTISYLKLIKFSFDWFEYFEDKKIISLKEIMFFLKENLNVNNIYVNWEDFYKFFHKKLSNINFIEIIYDSIDKNYITMVNSLLNSNYIDINLNNSNGNNKNNNKKSLINYALTNNNIINSDIINSIFIKTIQPNIKNLSIKERNSLLIKIIKSKNFYLFKKLTPYYSSPSEYITESGQTPLHYIFSSFSNNINISKKFSNYFFEIFNNKLLNHLNKDQWSAIHVCVQRCDINCLNYIFSKNNKNKFFLLNLKGKNNFNPLHISCNMDNIPVTKLLLENNVDVFARSSNYYKPRDYAKKNIFISKLLIMKENEVLNKKYYNKDLKNDNNINKIIHINQSRANINFYKEILINKDSSLLEISEAIYNITFIMLMPLTKKVSKEEFEKFCEKTFFEIDFSKDSSKNIFIVSKLSNIAINLNVNLFPIFNIMLNGSSRKLDKIIKNEIKRFNEIFKMLFMFKKENNSNIKENKLNIVNKSLIKKKINVINLKSNFAINNYQIQTTNNNNENSNNSNNNVNDSLDNITNNLKQKFNKIEIYNNNKNYKKKGIISRNSNNMSNESCNIHDSSASMSKIDSVNGIYLNIK